MVGKEQESLIGPVCTKAISCSDSISPLTPSFPSKAPSQTYGPSSTNSASSLNVFFITCSETQICPEDLPFPAIPTSWLFPPHSFLPQSQTMAPNSLLFANQGLAHCRNSTKTVLEHMNALNSFASSHKKESGASELALWLQLIGLSHASP